MNISVDAGGLCAKKNQAFGNAVFSSNLIQALARYDKKNTYQLYSFCRLPVYIRKLPMKLRMLLPKIFWMDFRVGFEELTRPKDVFLALNQAMPMVTRSKIISFSHGLSFYYFPHLYKQGYSRLQRQLDRMISKSSHIVVSSQKVKTEMISVYPTINNVHVIPFGIPQDMGKPTVSKKKEKTFLYVGMNHPIKQIDFIVDAFLQFSKISPHSGYSLLLVGPFSHLRDRAKKIQCVSDATRSDLKRLYQSATGYLTASFYESFNLPVLEALSQGCQPIGLSSAIIPELSPYVYIAHNRDTFIENMRRVADGERKNIEYRRLNSEFSWESYVEKLRKLYLV